MSLTETPASSVRRVKPFALSARSLLTILKAQPGQWMDARDVLAVFRRDPEVFDNVAAVIWAACRLAEKDKIETRYPPRAAAQYRVPPLPEPVREVRSVEEYSP